MTAPSPILRPLTPAEAGTMIQLIKEEGWNPGLHDASTFYQIADGGLLGAFLENQLIGSCAIFNHNAYSASFGLYILKPEFRGLGHGIWMTRRRLQMAGQRNISLDGVPRQIQTYRRIGFRKAHKNLRFEFSGEQPKPSATISLGTIPSEAIHRYDTPFFPGSREHYLSVWLNQPEVIARALTNDRDNLNGIMVLRPCFKGMKAGPFYASTPGNALTLLQDALYQCQGGPVYIDAPEINPNLPWLVNQLQGKWVSETTRMYCGYTPELNYPDLYGLTCLESG